jgi:ketosteroid isomerase-like protein
MRGWLAALVAVGWVGWVGRAAADVPDVGGEVRRAIDAEVQWLAGSADDRAPPAKLFGDDAVFSLPDAAVVHGGVALRGELAACAPQQPRLDDYAFTPGPGAEVWVSFTLRFQSASAGCGAPPVYRASEVVVGDGGAEWRIVAGAWSRGVADDEADDAAQGSALEAPALGKGPVDAAATALVGELASHGVDADAAGRDDVIVFGTAPGERTTSGHGFAAGWKAAWLGHVAIDGPVIGSVLRDGTLAWAIANLALDKRGGGTRFRVPVRAFLMFVKREGRGWSLAHVHLAVPTPRLHGGGSAKSCDPELDGRVRRHLHDTRQIKEARALDCATGRFRVAGAVVRATYVELTYVDSHGDHKLARGVMTTDGIRELHALTSDADATYQHPEVDETWEAVDLDGDGVDEILVDNHAYARADIHQIYVKGIDQPDSDLVRYAIDLRPKEIQAYCEGSVAKERAGKAIHLVVTMTTLVGDDRSDCLAKGRHVFAYERGKLVEQRR